MHALDPFHHKAFVGLVILQLALIPRAVVAEDVKKLADGDLQPDAAHDLVAVVDSTGVGRAVQNAVPEIVLAAADDNLEIRILKALDEPANLRAEDAPFSQAIAKLSETTGIPIEVDDGVFDLLPYGTKTILSAEIDAQPLRDVLEAILTPLALTFKVEPDRILTVATKPLQRIARRATWDEIALLDKLQSTSWSQQAFDQLKFQFRDARAGDYESNRQQLRKLAAAVGEGSLAEALEYACDQYGWSWYPSGDFIVVLKKSKQIEHQLNRRVSVQFAQASLKEALLDLADRAHVLLIMEPGVLTSLPAQTAQRFTLSIENATIRQVLEVIAGQTGLSYFIESEGIRITSNTITAMPGTGPAGPPSQGDAASELRALRANMVVGEITIPSDTGTSYSFFIREKDLPLEVNELRKHKIRSAVNEIRRLLFSEEKQD